MLSDPLIAATEDEVTLDPVTVGARVVTFQVIGTLLAGEYINFEVEDPAAVSGWRVMKLDDEEVKIVLGNDQVTFFAPAYVRPHKSVTTAACGLRSIAP